jgi:hypothetical protein
VAKQLIATQRDSLALCHAYAQIEKDAGNISVAKKVILWNLIDESVSDY